MLRSLTFVTAWLAAAACGRAQFQESEGGHGPRPGETSTQQLRVGFEISADSGPCEGLTVFVSLPIDWPEQIVRENNQDFSPTVTDVQFHDEGTIRLMIATIPFLPAGEEAHGLITYDVERHSWLPPEDPSGLVIPKKFPKDVRIHLGVSPEIESRNREIEKLADQIAKPIEGAWAKVEAIYDWVQANIQYQEQPLKGAVDTLHDGHGDCESMSGLFIALCRASGVPARIVWVPGHCYAEFYLADAEGQGYWFPCQVAGSPSFGGIPEHRPILQRGDNFRFKLEGYPREALRYPREHLVGSGGKPRVHFVRELVGGAGQ